MEIKPQWLLEGKDHVETPFSLLMLTHPCVVAPHYFKEADLEQLAKGDKKMPKAIGAPTSNSRAS